MPVQIDLSEMLWHPGMRQALDVEIPCNREIELDCAGSIKGHLVFTNTGNVLVVQGGLEGVMRSTCPRCLTDVRSHVTAPVDEEFSIEHNAVTGFADDETGFADPAARALFDENLLNVTELARQSVVLATPIDPLCREDCKGLCPQCGTDRNLGECDCEPEIVSPFAVLAGLKEEANGDG